MSISYSVEKAAPASLFEDYYARIYRHILSIVRDPAEADDLTQETFIRAYRSHSTLRDLGAQTTWLYRIATNVCLDRCRQRSRRAPMESEASPEELDLADLNAISLQQAVERGEMSSCVRRYLEGLPDSYRAVIIMHDLNGLSGVEISQALGESLATVKIRLHRARQKLRAALGTACVFSHDERNVLICEPKRVMTSSRCS